MLKEYQYNTAVKMAAILKSRGVVALYAPPRIGKTLTALKTIDLCGLNSTLVLTKKNAIKGWEQYRPAAPFNFKVINYEQINKINSLDFDSVIVDESHNFKAFPKASNRYKITKKIISQKPIILLSGTPTAEGGLDLFHQFGLSAAAPTGRMNAYQFFKIYGIPQKIRVNGFEIETYKKCKSTEVLKLYEPYIVKLTYDDANIQYQHTIQHINITPTIAQGAVAKAIKRGVYYAPAEPVYYESTIDKAVGLHMLESGIIKGAPAPALPSPKVEWLRNFIKEHTGETIAVMAYFIAEQEMLRQLFENDNVKIFSVLKNCEGVDLSDFNHFIIYSFGYSGAKFIQLKERVVNIAKNKATTAIVLTMEIFSKKVYNAVSQKMTFNKKMIEKAVMNGDGIG